MTKLSVNINKIALLRNSRGTSLPDLVEVALDCIRFGAEGITVHPRPDERHIKKSDIPLLKAAIDVELNIEGYPSEDFIQLVLDNQPAQVSLVPDPPNVLTSDSGWDTRNQAVFLKEVVSRFKKQRIRVSLFMNPEPELIRYAVDTGADRIELYTGIFSREFEIDSVKAIELHIQSSEIADELGLGLNAGHDLNLRNLRFYKEEVVKLLEVSIGHAIVCDSLYYGLQNTIQMYRGKLL
ncbi:MAG: pyridoxine 5'-phosphate synthase [Saprospiraceae bacterium]|nr:pyridoxine 5'-phosphate synthase [Saprospiraceae bacterium]